MRNNSGKIELKHETSLIHLGLMNLLSASTGKLDLTIAWMPVFAGIIRLQEMTPRDSRRQTARLEQDN